ncbi:MULTISPECIES: hypothetical protein [Streptomyces rochei group]|uniref:hypothetical protein n=1 Tax=Streptomyces rochei group TaxID=2867164 RepID=UPI0018747E54|nr:hypothetical protein [Streptomyces vinaceusdrappus]GHB98644.1 hypothetical protein GCM10010308_07590 [Streptomyces vinaceusdrappus]
MRSAWLLPGGPSEPGQTREDTRLSPLGTYTPESELRTRSGVIAGGDPFAATGAGAMRLQIGVGRAVAQGTDAQGAYPVCLDAPVTVDFPDGDAQFTRIDSVAVRVYDGLYDVNGQTLATVERVPGEARAVPVPPDMPSGAVRLWDVTVPAGASAGVGGINWSTALADRRPFTAAYGGIIPRGWGLGFDGAYDGQYRDTGTGLERWSAAEGAWQAYPPPAAGWRTYSPSVSNLTLGNGSVRARWRQYANHVQVAFRLVWGSGTTGNMPRLSIPVPAASLGGMSWTGTMTMSRGSGNWRSGTTWLTDDATTINTGIMARDPGSNQPEIMTNLAAASITMTAGGWIMGNVEYEIP